MHRYLPKLAAVDVATLVLMGLITCLVPASWIFYYNDAWPKGDIWQTVGLFVVALLNVTCALWIHLHPWIVLVFIYTLALTSFTTGLWFLVFELESGNALTSFGIFVHICQAALAGMVGQVLEKSPDRTAPFNFHRWVPLLCGGALMVAGAVAAAIGMDDENDTDYNCFGIKLGGIVTYVLFGIILAFPLWHRHENPLVRGGVASVTAMLVLITPLLGYFRVFMFYPIWLPGQILVAYALGGYQGEAQREMAINKMNTDQDEHGDAGSHSALPCEEEPLAGAAQPVAGIPAV